MGSSTGIGKQEKDGAVTILAAADLSFAHLVHDAKEFIRVLRFSPDGSCMAVGSADTMVMNVLWP